MLQTNFINTQDIFNWIFMLNSKTVTVIYIWAKREDIENITEPTIIHGSEVETQRD